MYSVIRIKGNRSRWKGIALKPFFIAKLDKVMQDVCVLFRIAFSIGDGIVLS